jgi:hypothetical protein
MDPVQQLFDRVLERLDALIAAIEVTKDEANDADARSADKEVRRWQHK